MVTAWLTGPEDENTIDFVQRLLDDGDIKSVGGFSLISGKLRKRAYKGREGLEPLAIISNRCEHTQDVPWIAGQRNEVYGLSNTHYMDPVKWPKIDRGKTLLSNVISEAIAHRWDENELVEKLYSVLSTDTLPLKDGQSFEDCLFHLKKSIFIPLIGGGEAVEATPKADNIRTAAGAGSNGHAYQNGILKDELKQDVRPDSGTNDVMAGRYGTQRQTIVLVDWDGNVTFRERALWDENGNPITKGKGDMKFEFKIEGWHDEDKENGAWSKLQT